MTKQIIFILIVSLLFIGGDCKNDDNPIIPESKIPAFYGSITDQNGNVLSDVSVYYTFMTRSLAKSSNTLSTISIPFSLTDTSDVILSIFKLGSKDTLAIPLNGRRPPGNYSIGYETTKLSNGIYTFYLKINQTTTRIDFVHQTYDYSLLFKTSPTAISSVNGQFILSYDSLGVTRKFGNTKIITDSIDLILVKQGYQILNTGFKIDSTKAIEYTFKLSK
jgi:hypothetical protein